MDARILIVDDDPGNHALLLSERHADELMYKVMLLVKYTHKQAAP
jgi:hypothetical protein